LKICWEISLCLSKFCLLCFSVRLNMCLGCLALYATPTEKNVPAQPVHHVPKTTLDVKRPARSMFTQLRPPYRKIVMGAFGAFRVCSGQCFANFLGRVFRTVFSRIFPTVAVKGLHRAVHNPFACSSDHPIRVSV
jgi:hypothetical protein